MEKAQITFGRRLRLIRKEQGFTLEVLGKRASIGYKHIADIERGIKVPSFDAIDRLAMALDVEPSQFFLGDKPSDVVTNRELRKLFETAEQKCDMKCKQLLATVLRFVTEAK